MLLWFGIGRDPKVVGRVEASCGPCGVPHEHTIVEVAESASLFGIPLAVRTRRFRRCAACGAESPMPKGEAVEPAP